MKLKLKDWPLLLLLIAAVAVTTGKASYTLSIITVIFVIIFFITKEIKITYGWFSAVCFFYFMAQSVILSSIHPFGSELALLAAQSGIYLLAVVFFANYKSGSNLGKGFLILGYIDAIAIVLKWAFGMSPYFIFNNPAFDSGFVACMIPFMLEELERGGFYALMIPISALACFVTKSSTGVLAFGVAYFSYYLSAQEFEPSAWVKGLVFSACSACLGYFMQGKALFQGSGRYEIWRMMLRDYWARASHLLGFGIGSFVGIVPDQIATHAKVIGDLNPVIFWWADNDYLQTLFETGLIGLGLAVALLCYAGYRSRRTPWLFASLMTFGAVSLTQKPCRFFLLSLLGALLISFATEKVS